MENGTSNNCWVDTWKETINGKVNCLEKEWEAVKKGLRTQKTGGDKLVEVLKKSSGVCAQTPCTGRRNSKVLYRQSLSPFRRVENRNFESLISKCQVFQEGLSREKRNDIARKLLKKTVNRTKSQFK